MCQIGLTESSEVMEGSAEAAATVHTADVWKTYSPACAPRPPFAREVNGVWKLTCKTQTRLQVKIRTRPRPAAASSAALRENSFDLPTDQ